jgi:succinate dehydrogenase hydrophobic anchor subunit
MALRSVYFLCTFVVAAIVGFVVQKRSKKETVLGRWTDGLKPFMWIWLVAPLIGGWLGIRTSLIHLDAETSDIVRPIGLTVLVALSVVVGFISTTHLKNERLLKRVWAAMDSVYWVWIGAIVIGLLIDMDRRVPWPFSN